MANNGGENGAVTLNLAELGAVPPIGTAAAQKPDTLFGPNIGIVSGGPAWTEALNGKQAPEELTLDVVKAWIAKSKEANQPTTTLQALVNLKRPTLRLTPLKPSTTEEEEPIGTLHALEFEYDADAPQCAITVSVVLPPDQRTTDGAMTAAVFETTTEGGFGKTLVVDQGAVLELGRYEHHVVPATSSPVAENVAPAPAPDSMTQARPSVQDRRTSRFNFHLRSRRHSQAVAGPALAVVDAEASNKEGDKTTTDGEDEGVKVFIRLSARDAAGAPLASMNEQITYLHVVRFGAAPTAAEGAAISEDTRPWVVKVVKREAIIGTHVFHLHEIYGLSAHSSSHPAPVAAPPASHTYPPNAAPQPPVEDEPSSECLLCLSAPREVVLLPCRHLVACRDCALNMIEFGAGGQIHQAEDTEAAADAGDGEGATPPVDGAPGAVANANTTTAAAAAPVPVVAPRRKRKAKGWFCPVCRQPYTSLLRITTTPPADEKEEKTDTATAPAPTTTEPAPAVTTGGPLANLSRPGFLRGLSLGNRGQAGATAPVDIERGT